MLYISCLGPSIDCFHMRNQTYLSMLPAYCSNVFWTCLFDKVVDAMHSLTNAIFTANNKTCHGLNYRLFDSFDPDMEASIPLIFLRILKTASKTGKIKNSKWKHYIYRVLTQNDDIYIHQCTIVVFYLATFKHNWKNIYCLVMYMVWSRVHKVYHINKTISFWI